MLPEIALEGVGHLISSYKTGGVRHLIQSYKIRGV